MKIQCALKRIYTSAVRNLRETVLIIITGSLGIARKKSSFEKLLFLAEDMGFEEVRSIQTLKFQGGKAPSTFVPGFVPNRTILD